MLFLWLFLPTVYIAYRLLAPPYRNALLLAASLIFYAWGGVSNLFILFVCILINYVGGRVVMRFRGWRLPQRFYLIVTVALNLGILGVYKYWGFVVSQFTGEVAATTLPIGISFFTFQALSYVIDVYRGETDAQRSLPDLALYISLFPQLIAGPIVKYRDVAAQLTQRVITSADTAYGMRRFILGLSKKVILANTFAAVADNIMAVDASQLTMGAAIGGILVYALQIYYDFSGYSDMAIGLGRVFGFTFHENFNYPYTAASMTDFWRRWHISLSSWFKDYVYIPLGGNRKGTRRTYANLIVVFLLTGLWHGAGWNFIVWGGYNGAFLIIERVFGIGRTASDSRLNPNPVRRALAHVYTCVVVLVGWVFFRANNLSHALSYIASMMRPITADPIFTAWSVFDRKTTCFVIIGILLCGPLQRLWPTVRTRLRVTDLHIRYAELVGLPLLLIICIMLLSAGTYNPFIYFRF